MANYGSDTGHDHKGFGFSITNHSTDHVLVYEHGNKKYGISPQSSARLFCEELGEPVPIDVRFSMVHSEEVPNGVVPINLRD